MRDEAVCGSVSGGMSERYWPVGEVVDVADLREDRPGDCAEGFGLGGADAVLCPGCWTGFGCGLGLGLGFGLGCGVSGTSSRGMLKQQRSKCVLDCLCRLFVDVGGFG